MKVDAHQHFWKYHPAKHRWITDSMAALKRDYLPTELKQEIDNAGFDGSVAVQAEQSEEETYFLLDLARQYSFIKGVIGWVDLRSKAIIDRLAYFSHNNMLKGFRHIIQDEQDDEFLLQSDFLNGIGQLRQFDFCYDIIIYPKHLRAAKKFVSLFPSQRFVLDHAAKPLIRDHIISPWDRELKMLARHENVYCKLSGLVTEAPWQQWRAQDFTPYLDMALEAFGVDRLMVGSDWPVCRLSAEYGQVMEIVQCFIMKLSPNEQQKILGDNAMRWYNLQE
ncbi:MAG: amidohydrolase family protein [Ignavibacteria bacterium]|nr:amidohydrolase family protein [Ignavibacteria bacterium]MBI3766031.1 amidohydrolase family protein [Ignavibacteriales bacterium]